MPAIPNLIGSPRQISFWASLILLLVFIAGYFSTLEFLSGHWRGIESSTYSYGFLVLACVVYLLVLKREEFRKLNPEPVLWAILPLIGFVMIWFFARIADVQKVQLVVIPLILLSATTLSLGLKYFRLAAIPICILYFALPLWDTLWPYLQDITTFVTHVNLQIIGRPVFVQGNILQLPNGSFFIDTSCGGLRFLLVSSILSLMYSDMYNLSVKRSAALVMIGVLLAFLANWIRVLSVVLIGDATNMESSLVEDHANFGWVIYFAFVLVPLFFITNYFRPPVPESSSPQTEAKIGVPEFNSRKLYTAFILTFVALLLGPAMASFVSRESNSSQIEIVMPEGKLPWVKKFNLPISSASRWSPQFSESSSGFFAEYENANEVVEVHVIHYQRQQQDAELINVDNEIAGAGGWVALENSRQLVVQDINQLESTSLDSIEIRSSQSQLKKVWYWYNIGGQNTVNPYVAKIYQVLTLLQGRTDASLIAIGINCGSNCEQADAIFSDFTSAMMPEILAIFD